MKPMTYTRDDKISAIELCLSLLAKHKIIEWFIFQSEDKKWKITNRLSAVSEEKRIYPYFRTLYPFYKQK